MRHLRLPAFPLPTAEIDMIGWTISDLQAGYRAGRFSASDVAATCLARIARLEPYLNAFISVNMALMEDAAQVDAEWRAGVRKGPLHGVPIVIKDNMNMAGVRTTAGYAGFASDDRVVDPSGGVFNGLDLIPERDASVVARLKQAGALIVGKSNLPDFGLDGLRADSSYNGDTLNPYNPRFAPGASSTGSAAAVAAGFGLASLGTDTAGSILFPASAQSLVGLKPSFGMVPIDGVFPGLSSHHDVAGPIAKTVSDVAVLMDVLAGPAAADPRTGRRTDKPDFASVLDADALRGARIGLFEPGQWAPDLHPSVARHYRVMTDVLTRLGAELVPVVFADTDWRVRWKSRTSFVATNSYLAGVDAFLGALGGSNPSSRSAFKERAGFEIGVATTAPLHGLLSDANINVGADDAGMIAVVEQAGALRAHYEAILRDKGIDALFFPRSVSPLPDIGGDTLAYLGDQVVGTEINEMGLPVVTVPAGFLEDGRPIAIDIVGAAIDTDAAILAFAHAFEQATLLRRSAALPG
ncbi:amidase [Ancylobacter dichloromethanicus]|uniref:Amidase n=2 Tax=Ancylobacter dichloromethanicus TaxID=518825 RepID=A0A9W6JBU2_9HYPH|nr:amidase [Ancylobacter dichloromethanicus]MBS7553690.1 amidase [Ancylobacter dichloromethanicus]GLK72758.1 amidase [Ancylobacter dichloromethanicus]